jgi:PadR family transcriptional regulator, regulatory protein AphA
VKLEHILLGVLLMRPSTGYDLKRYMDARGTFLRPNTQMSQVYRCLSSMEERGWVWHTVEPRPGAQDAKTYRVTDEGITVFMDWLTAPYSPTTIYTRDPGFYGRLAFCGFLQPDQVIELVDREILARQLQIKRYRDRDRTVPEEPELPFDADLQAWVEERSHELGSLLMDQHVAWCIELRAELQSRSSERRIRAVD